MTEREVWERLMRDAIRKLVFECSIAYADGLRYASTQEAEWARARKFDEGVNEVIYLTVKEEPMSDREDVVDRMQAQADSMATWPEDFWALVVGIKEIERLRAENKRLAMLIDEAEGVLNGDMLPRRSLLDAARAARDALERTIGRAQRDVLGKYRDSVNRDAVEFCGNCGAPCVVVRPGKTQCESCDWWRFSKDSPFVQASGKARGEGRVVSAARGSETERAARRSRSPAR